MCGISNNTVQLEKERYLFMFVLPYLSVKNRCLTKDGQHVTVWIIGACNFQCPWVGLLEDANQQHWESYTTSQFRAEKALKRKVILLDE